MPEDVGERLVLGPAGDPLLELGPELGRQLTRSVGELLDLDSERVRDQRLGVAAGLVAAGGGDRGLGFLDGLRNRHRGPHLALTVSCHGPQSLPLLEI